MVEIIKFVYIMILYVFLLLILEASGSKLILIFFISCTIFQSFLVIFLYSYFIYITEECVTDADCEILYSGNKWPLICSNIGYCLSSYKGKIYLSSISKTFIFFACYNVVTPIICLS